MATQSKKDTIYWVTLAIHDKSQFNRIIELATGCKYYAYIYHDHDENTERHLHVVCQDRHSLRTWAKYFELPENMIEVVKNYRSINRYLIHKDNPEKYQYNPDDIVTNCPMRLKSYLDDNNEVNPRGLFDDLMRLKKHLITREEFIEKYQFFIYKQSFLSQYKILTDIINNYD